MDKMNCLLLSMFLGSCGNTSMQLKSLFEEAEIELVSPEKISENLFASLRSLQAVLGEGENSMRTTLPFCTGIMISPKHLITAAHCAKHEFISNPFHIAQAGKLNYVRFGSLVRLNYEGEIDARSDSASANFRTLKTPLYADKDLDFAILEVPEEQISKNWIDLQKLRPENSSLSLLGFPNGVPLSIAPCHYFQKAKDLWMGHDCDALSGSSGGLIANIEFANPVAMHLAGPRDNEGDFFVKNARYESAKDFAIKRKCVEDDIQCIQERGYNRAVLFTSIRNSLINKAPEIWKFIIEFNG